MVGYGLQSRFASTIKSLVPKKGLEPPRRCRHMDLNHARLPVPPLRLIALRTSEYSQKVSLQKSGRLSTPTFIVQTVSLLSNLRAQNQHSQARVHLHRLRPDRYALS
jgi:hypothetical protein